MRILFSVYLLLMGITAYSQSSPESITNVQVRYRSIEDVNIPPVSVNDPRYEDRKVEVEVTITVSNPDSINVLVIKTGRQQASSDILSAALLFTKEEGKTYYTYKDKKYEIKNKTVVFTELVPEYSSRKSSYFSLEVTDRKNKKSKTFTKKVN